ncbi:MAG TPA: hypothetical protein VEW95_09470 [Candidatus Limnocylindrales bacterium]|nr:hypothetical protein [Candidatus Limnocylindrales bacterium]
MFERLAELFRSDPKAAERALREAELSHNQLHSSLRDALKASLTAAGIDKVYTWPKDVYDDRVVYEVEMPTGTRLFQRSYTVNEAGVVTLGDDAIEVKQQTVYTPITPVTESGDPAPAPADGDPAPIVSAVEAAFVGDVIPLIEKSVRKDGTVPLKIIQPGWGSSGFYDAKVLERDGAKAFPKGTKMYWNHPTVTEESERPERDLRDLAATLVSDAHYAKEGPGGPGLYADAKVVSTYRETVEELAPHIGTSIRTHGSATHGTAEGKSGPIVEALLPASQSTSVDFVTIPGAGGQVLQLFEAARGGREINPKPTQEDPPVVDELSEAVRQRLETQDTEIARLREGQLFREARDVATAAIERYDIPDVTRARLVESLAKNPPVVEETKALDVAAFTTRCTEAVTAEVEYLAKAAGIGDGQVRDMGGALGGGEPVSEADAEAELAGIFQTGFGLSESAAKAAAGGREH